MPRALLLTVRILGFSYQRKSIVRALDEGGNLTAEIIRGSLETSCMGGYPAQGGGLAASICF